MSSEFQFPQSSEHTLFSNAVVDVFTQLNQGLDVLCKMDCPNPEVYHDMMKRFAKVRYEAEDTPG